ncbi:packaged DNA stabilization protein [Lelliottia wanjuensis]|uniref:packaged DNA stabilization protein n=1 Tax=Lelliottia wanjuensis TaxID=3050585 RepID=UPI00254AFEAD|nr:packaged DNA stabilization protein [Lelliottia sp. V86_10]MDK9585417.1 packaged DNA stabilization protein [Lelliottia sp. V86_10]
MDKTTTLPLMKGTGKNPLISDYVNLFPVNMLTVPPKIVTEGGYMRSFPGVVKLADVDGASRGVLANPFDSLVYRVCGKKLYQASVEIADVDGEDRVSMAGSDKSVAVAAGGLMTIRKNDGTTFMLDNWPPAKYFPGSTVILVSGNKGSGFDGSLPLTETMTDKGRLILTLTPATTSGATGAVLEVDKIQKTFNQDVPAAGTPYLTDVFVSGFDISGTTLTVGYTFNANGADGNDNTAFVWTQVVEPSDILYAQYDLGTVADICHANSRYAWIKAGTNTFGVTDIDDETHPDRYRPFMTAEAFPDPAVGIAALNGDIVVFGTVSTEFFTLTGSSDTTKPIYKSQRAALIPVGIAGVHCKALVGEKFAVISNPAGGKVSVYLLGDGRATEIASPEISRELQKLRPDDLAKGVVEAVGVGIHQLIIVRAGSLAWCYDLTSKNWCNLTSGPDMKPHIATDFALEMARITCGDIRHGQLGWLDESTAAQYGEPQSHILYTPMFSAPGAVLADLELNTASGTAQSIEHLAISATTDGAIFPYEVQVISDGPQRYTERVLLPNVGYVAKDIAFRFRSFSRTPFTATSCKIRVT